MNKKFNPQDFEKKWQAKWAEDNVYHTTESKKPKTFVLDMFPYPSGEGLHVGHPKGYIATDIYSRFKRMTGHEVLHPMGWDAFGLPAENFAIKHKVHPRVAVEKNVARFKEQLQVLGFDYDWEREINTTDPEYYKWTQWIFVQLFKKGLAYESHEPINWCPGCQTGLANEDLESDGTCERCGSLVEKRPMRQWVLKIRSYADRMLEDLDSLKWPEHIKEAQRNWIGRSEGAEIDFKLSTKDRVTVFTTRPDTLFGVTYLVLAPEHPLIQKNKSQVSNWDEVMQYIELSTNKKEQDRLDDTKEKTGVKLEGITATNPANNEEIPVYIADYVLASYGTGAIMAVPAHDERDYAFAEKFNIPIKQVVRKVFGETLPNAIPRVAAGAIVYNPKTEKYLVSFSHEFNKHSPWFGGLEDGEDFSETAVRETLEESGYKTKFIRYIGDEVESHFYHPGKDLNRSLISRMCLLEIIDQEPITVSEEEKKKQEPVWLTKEELVSKFTEERDSYDVSMLFDPRPFTGMGNVCNSDEFDDLSSKEAKVAITEKVGGRMTATYKIRDWVFSRQRYWGEPIPIIHCEKCGPVAVPEDQLPVVLPEVEHYEPTGTGESPLANITDWVNTTCPECGEGAKRETNTMPQWAGSSWYYLRFMDNHNNQALVSKEKEQYWAPVDVYVGGDHAVRHLIYARFWHKFLYDLGVVSTIEPFQRLEFLGFILAEDGRKMSKRWGNIINPDDIVKLVGADTLRVYEMFMGPFENTIAWSQDGLVGARRFLERVNGLSEHFIDNENELSERQLHKTIKKVCDDIEEFKFNTAISAMMVYVNTVEKEGLTQTAYETFLKLLAPFAPHLTEELWYGLGYTKSIHLESYPKYEQTLVVDNEVTIGVQVNGRVRGNITISTSASEDEAIALAKTVTSIKSHITGNIKKVIYKPAKILNIVI
ncbi:leucine--tRNA ligase [Candidatus Kaiserbacteria bacterium]|nr:leucine--tRNA ligase [Candidatus Kaiserbacteria bacterium]